MNKYIAYFVCILFFFVLHSGGNCPAMLLDNCKQLEVENSDTFEIFLRVKLPHHEFDEERDDFHWPDRDYWKLTGYDHSAFKLIKEDASALGLGWRRFTAKVDISGL